MGKYHALSLRLLILSEVVHHVDRKVGKISGFKIKAKIHQYLPNLLLIQTGRMMVFCCGKLCNHLSTRRNL